MYVYRGRVIKVVDGDTLHVALDLGCDVTVQMVVRLAGVNAPEKGTLDGAAATGFVESFVAANRDADGYVMIRTIKDRKEKFGRYLATVGNGRDLGEELIAAGLAQPWDGSGPRPV